MMRNPNSARVFKNAMEELVLEEVERQTQRLSPAIREYVSPAEVAAYALNRLPPMYATSQKGWRSQRLKVKNEIANQVATAVRQALVAVQRDPLRVSSPLPMTLEGMQQEVALSELRSLLQQEDLTWNNVVDVIEQTLIKTARGQVTWHRRNNPVPRQGYDWQDDRHLL